MSRYDDAADAADTRTANERYLATQRWREKHGLRAERGPEVTARPAFAPVEITAEHPCWGAMRAEGREPDASQVEAVRAALSARVACLVGYAGAGKSTCSDAIVQAVDPDRKATLVLAPTGKAAKRATETTGLRASTIHRALAKAEHTQEDPFAGVRLVLVDEASMMDVELAAKLAHAIPRDARVVFVGDPAQLPPVRAGAVLRDLIASGTVPVGRLEKIWRTAAESGIPHVAAAIRRGDQGAFPGVLTPDAQVVHADEQSALEAVVTEYVEAKRADPDADIMVLSPQHAGVVGVGALNATIQAALNPVPTHRDEFVALGGGREAQRASVGDVVLNTRNDYGRDVVNGDLGRVVAVGPATGMDIPDNAHATNGASLCRAIVEFPGEAPGSVRYVAYTSREAASDLVLGYAMTCHKAQGSQADRVLVAIPAYAKGLNRNWLYTALTRASGSVTMYGATRTFVAAIGIDSNDARRTRLKERIAAAARA
jgi:exodeoxyribonuclease V alpha subunit